MKLSKLLYYCSLLFCIVTFTQCKKNKNEEPQLPPETTTGAMTFGCKIDGKIFVPKDGRGRPGLYVQYVNLGNGAGGGWFLNIPANDWSSSPIESVHIETDSLLLSEGENYDFKNEKGHPRAFYAKEMEYLKLNTDSGQLTIIKFDQTNRILSGTFSFTGTNSSGQKVNVTDGRFDVRY